MATKFRYTRVPLLMGNGHPSEVLVDRPLVSVLLTSADRRTVGWIALVDSGADECAFPLSLAAGLGLKPNRMKQEKVRGVGGRISTVYKEIVTVDLGRDILFQAEIGFTDGLNAIGTGVLGQVGLFDHFDVNFQLRRGVFTIG